MLRLLAAAAALLILIIFGMVATAAVVFAQDAAPAPAEGGYEALAALVRESFTASLLAAGTALIAWFAPKVQKWFGGYIDLNATMEAVEWEKYVDDAARKAFGYAQAKLGVTPAKLHTLEQRGDFLAWALHYMRSHHEDIVAFADKNGNGVIDIMETRLVEIAPQLPVGVPSVQGFMAAPAPKRKPPAKMANAAAASKGDL